METEETIKVRSKRQGSMRWRSASRVIVLETRSWMRAERRGDRNNIQVREDILTHEATKMDT